MKFITILVLLFPVLLLAQDRKDVVKFSHSFHLIDAGAECQDCHSSVAESEMAGDDNLPTMDDCFGCHDDSEDNCTQCHYEGKDELTWQNPERPLIYSHKKHLAMEDVECTTCHQGLETVNYSSSANLPAMQTCQQCHDGSRAEAECAVCHTQSLAELKPQNHATDWLNKHGSFARLDEQNCAGCHTRDYCQQCHEGAYLSQEPGVPDGAFAPYNAHETSGSESGLMRQKVHDLNFRFTHAIEARDHRTDCITCHDPVTFCADCHVAATGDADEFMPEWHKVPGFATVGIRGSGGGSHAERARKDIESCMACHDDQGDDPVCLQCHIDFNPGKGNDPKTHPSGFAGSLGKGPWHNDKSYVCFNCHQDTGQKGLGFCGYCHQ